ncbi:MAG: ABC transporter ATP-binding protein [Acidimicrobiales bacterium]
MTAAGERPGERVGPGTRRRRRLPSLDRHRDEREPPPGLATPPALSFAGVGKRFGDTWVVRDLELCLPPGSITGLIGPSGCGKTTTIRLAMGAYRPDEGDVRLLGRIAHEMSTAERVVAGYLPQEPMLFEELSLWENLNFLAALNGVRFRRRAELRALLDFVDLRGEESKLVNEASGGMKRRLALAATLAHNPPVLMLDEPTAGIDPVLRRRFWDQFRELRDRGHTLVVATQYVGEAADCDHVVLLNQGRIAAVGTPDELRRRAVGGDLLDVSTARPAQPATLQALMALEPVRDARFQDPQTVRLTVTDAASTLPLVLDCLRHSGEEVTASEEVSVDYDEVFIALVGVGTT